MFNLIRKFRKIPEAKKIIVYGKLSFLKHLLTFSFKIIVGVIFQSWFIIAIALFGLCIGIVKNNCSKGLKKNKDSVKDIKTYISGGAILAVSSIIYILYSFFQIYYPSNTRYNIFIAIAIAAFAFYYIILSFCGVIRARVKTMLIKEYKFTNFSSALNNIMLAQVAICSFTKPHFDAALYNGIMGMVCGFIVLAIGTYLIIDGAIKYYRYNRIIKNYPEIQKYINHK